MSISNNMEKKFNCDLCNISFRDNYGFKRHLNSKLHKNRLEGTNHKCNKCNKDFASPQSLYNHKQICNKFIFENKSNENIVYMELLKQKDIEIKFLREQNKQLLLQNKMLLNQKQNVIIKEEQKEKIIINAKNYITNLPLFINEPYTFQDFIYLWINDILKDSKFIKNTNDKNTYNLIFEEVLCNYIDKTELKNIPIFVSSNKPNPDNIFIYEAEYDNDENYYISGYDNWRKITLSILLHKLINPFYLKLCREVQTMKMDTEKEKDDYINQITIINEFQKNINKIKIINLLFSKTGALLNT